MQVSVRMDSSRTTSPPVRVPELPGAAFEAGPVLVLVALAGALIAAGMAGFRCRDIHTPA